MRKFSINCDFGGQLAPFDIFIGQPEQGHHPLHFQADWLQKQRGGTILPEVMDAIAKLQTLAQENGVPLEDLCVYALGSAQDEAAPTESQSSTEEAAVNSSDAEPQTEAAPEESALATDTISEAQDSLDTSEPEASEALEPPQSLQETSEEHRANTEATSDAVTTEPQQDNQAQGSPSEASDEQQKNENK